MRNTLKQLFIITFGLALSFCTGITFAYVLSLPLLLTGFAFAAASLIPINVVRGSLLMAVTQNTLIGRSRQKIGGTVMRTWKGLNILQSKPLSVANPKTTNQQIQRSKMIQLINYFRQHLGFIRLAFAELPIGTTSWARFIGLNLKSAFTAGGPPAPFAPESLIVSSGSLVNATITNFSNPSGRNISITWTDNSGQPGANASDRAVLVTASGSGEIYYLTDGSQRNDGSMTVTVPGSTTLSNFECHFYFDNSALRKSSDSLALGAV